MSTQMDILKARLFDNPDRKTTNFSIFPGDKPATPEQIAGEINRAMDEVEARGFVSGIDIDGDIKPVVWKDFIAELEAKP